MLIEKGNTEIGRLKIMFPSVFSQFLPYEKVHFNNFFLLGESGGIPTMTYLTEMWT